MVRKLSNQHIGVNSTENIISIKMLLAAVISQEKSNLYVSYCPVLDLYSQGSTSQEAEKNITEAILLFIESCVKRDTLTKVLKDCGFSSPHQKQRKRKLNPAPELTATNARQISIPTELPMLVYGVRRF